MNILIKNFLQNLIGTLLHYRSNFCRRGGEHSRWQRLPRFPDWECRLFDLFVSVAGDAAHHHLELDLSQLCAEDFSQGSSEHCILCPRSTGKSNKAGSFWKEEENAHYFASTLAFWNRFAILVLLTNLTLHSISIMYLFVKYLILFHVIVKNQTCNYKQP